MNIKNTEEAGLLIHELDKLHQVLDYCGDSERRGVRFQLKYSDSFDPISLNFYGGRLSVMLQNAIADRIIEIENRLKEL